MVLSPLVARALQTRALVRAPIFLYRHGFGWVCGTRIIMLEHLGRRSGLPRYVCLEVVERPSSRQVVVVSGFGTQAQWYRNLRTQPDCHVSVGRLRREPATARLLSEDESTLALRRYQEAHPRAWKHLRGALGHAVGHRVETLPVVRLDLATPAAPRDPASTPTGRPRASPRATERVGALVTWVRRNGRVRGRSRRPESS